MTESVTAKTMSRPHPIESYRVAAALSRRELGEKIGVSRVTIRRWEVGERLVDPDLLPRITELTGIPASVLRPDLAKLFAEVGP